MKKRRIKIMISGMKYKNVPTLFQPISKVGTLYLIINIIDLTNDYMCCIFVADLKHKKKVT
jgi:hypothetical protein